MTTTVAVATSRSGRVAVGAVAAVAPAVGARAAASVPPSKACHQQDRAVWLQVRVQALPRAVRVAHVRHSATVARVAHAHRSIPLAQAARVVRVRHSATVARVRVVPAARRWAIVVRVVRARHLAIVVRAAHRR
jgi:hypothetical protein